MSKTKKLIAAALAVLALAVVPSAGAALSDATASPSLNCGGGSSGC